jgi:hypothetical protein
VAAGERVEVSDSLTGVRNREYQSVFFLLTDLDLSQFTPDPEEVAGLAALPIQQAMDLFMSRVSTLDVETVTVEPTGKLTPARRKLAVADFIPRIQRYYLAALIAAERVCEGKRDIAIS